MVMQAQLADGRILEFPDGTDPSIIQSTVKKTLGIEDVGVDIPTSADTGDREEPGLLEQAGSAIAGVAEPAAAIISGIAAEPIAGLAGLGAALLPGEPGAAARAVEETREALTFKPRTEAGQAGLQEVGEALAPVGEAISGAETFLGDQVFEATGSPALAAAAKTIPTAIGEALGFGIGGKLAKVAKKGPSKRKIKRAVVDSAPQIETMKNTARNIYTEIDDAGVTIKPESYRRLFNKISQDTKKQGLDVRTTPRAAGALDVLKDTLDTSPTLTEIDTLRKAVGKVAQNIDPAESSLAVRMISDIDDYLDNIKQSDISSGSIKSGDVSRKYKAARNLWGRARRSETIQEALIKAEETASGVENGIRIEFGKIVNSKKSKFFPKEEIASMREVIKGDFKANLLKHVGKFGISLDRSGTNLLAFLGGAGGAVGGGGLGGGALVLTIGTASRELSKFLAKRQGKFIDAVTRAGIDADEIVGAYLTAFPKSKRTAIDLSLLLSDPQIDISGLLNSANKIKREAAEIAEGRRVIGAAVGALAPTVIPEEQ